MSEAKRMPEKKDVAASVDAGQKDLQKRADEAEAKGFIGVEVDPLPNSRYSLESGPESPSHDEQRQAAAKEEEQA